MFTLRPGRSWRHNPSYVSALTGLDSDGLRTFDGAQILDVLGIEFDGVDVCATVGETPLFASLGALLQAVLRLAQGAPAAQACIGIGPTYLVLQARGDDVLLSLLSMRAPARLLANRLLVDAARLRASLLGAASRVVGDLLETNSALRGAPSVRRLTRDLGTLSRAATLPAPPWPAPHTARKGFVSRSGAAAVRVDVSVPPESAARLAARAAIPEAPLAALLGPGELTLRFSHPPRTSTRARLPALTLTAPPWLALRELLRGAQALIATFESGEPLHLLHFGVHELRFDLTRDELRSASLREAMHAPPLVFAEACARAAVAFAKRARTRVRGATTPSVDEPLEELAATATALLKHCRDLSTGQLQRAPQAALPPILSTASESARPLPARLRRLVHRVAFEIPVGPLGERAIHLFAGAQVAILEAATGLVAIELSTSARLWQLDGPFARPDAFCRANDGGLFALHEGALVHLRPESGEQIFRRVISRAGERCFRVARGCVVTLSAKGLALVRDDGTLAFRTRLPEEPLFVCEGDGVIVARLPSGQLVGIDASDGAELWRRRVGVSSTAMQIRGARLILCATDLRGATRLVALAVTTGESLWERPIAPQTDRGAARELALTDELCATLTDRSLIAFRLEDGAPAFTRELPWSANSRIHSIERSAGSALLAVGPGASATLFDARGNPLWARPALTPTLSPPLAPIQRDTTILLCADAAEFVDVESGRTLARPAMADVDSAALLPDLGLLVHLRDGALILLRVATHFRIA